MAEQQKALRWQTEGDYLYGVALGGQKYPQEVLHRGDEHLWFPGDWAEDWIETICRVRIPQKDMKSSEDDESFKGMRKCERCFPSAEKRARKPRRKSTDLSMAGRIIDLNARRGEATA